MHQIDEIMSTDDFLFALLFSFMIHWEYNYFEQAVESMNLENAPVRHIRFGAGTVLRCENGMIAVHFPEAGEKQFVFPEAFTKFLRCEDPEQADTIVKFVPKERLDQMSETGHHQGVILNLSAVVYASVEDILKKAEEDARHREQEALHKAMLAARAPAKASRSGAKTAKPKKA